MLHEQYKMLHPSFSLAKLNFLTQIPTLDA